MILPKNCKNWGQKGRRKGGQFKEGGTQFFQKCMKVALLVGGKGGRMGGGSLLGTKSPLRYPPGEPKGECNETLVSLVSREFSKLML